MKIISIGDLVTDYYYKNGKLVGVNGGMTSHNIIANISKLGFNTSVYGTCGNDMAGKIAIDSLSILGVDISNIEIINDIKTRLFHVSYNDSDGKLEFKSKKRCPLCNEKRWYEESKIDCTSIINKINNDDVLVFDNLNTKNQFIIDDCNNIKMLDLGQYFELDNYTNEEIINKISNKFDLINLNERVEKYLYNRFSINTLNDLYNLLNPKMIIVTKGKNGSSFVFDNKIIDKKVINPSKELDSTGAGDAFFSVFIASYIKNNYTIDEDFINKTFDEATKLTKKVVKKFGARGHLNSLYKIKSINDKCSCDDFDIIKRKQIKRCNININNLETRVINAINSSAYDKLVKIDFKSFNNSVFIGTGGSFAGAKFSSKVINELYGINTLTLLPRDFYYRNNTLVDSLFLFSYSGTTNDVLCSSNLITKNKYIITKGEIQKVVTKASISKTNVISYRSSTNKGKERGFLSFEGVLSPASLFLKLYFDKNKKDISSFVRECLNYWKEYFNNLFNNNDFIKDFFNVGDCFNIFTGDFTECASFDLESKIIESGIYSCIMHEKKNFSHGRFINYEHLSTKKNIYFRQKNISDYEKKLLKYLSKDKNLIIESRYDGILSEFDLLVASQYLIYYISNYLNIDISKPTYSEDAMNIYFYKGNL